MKNEMLMKQIFFIFHSSFFIVLQLHVYKMTDRLQNDYYGN